MGLIKKPFELEIETFIRSLIYGQPGLGKTTLALSAPLPLMLDFDRGTHRVRSEHLADTVQITSWNDIDAVMKEDLSRYQTLIIDTVGKMLDYISAQVIKENPKMGRSDGSLTLQGFGVRKMKFLSFLRQAMILRKHVVFVAHEREERDNDSRFVRPDVGGSSGSDLIKELDLVGYMEAIGKQRTVSFDPSDKYYAKNTCHLDPQMIVPELKEGQRNDFLSHVFLKYEDALEMRKQNANKYRDILIEIDGIIDNVTTAEDANQVITWVQSKQHIWDSKLYASAKLRDKAKELRLTLQKGKYVESTTEHKSAGTQTAAL